MGEDCSFLVAFAAGSRAVPPPSIFVRWLLPSIVAVALVVTIFSGIDSDSFVICRGRSFLGVAASTAASSAAVEASSRGCVNIHKTHDAVGGELGFKSGGGGGISRSRGRGGASQGEARAVRRQHIRRTSKKKRNRGNWGVEGRVGKKDKDEEEGEKEGVDGGSDRGYTGGAAFSYRTGGTMVVLR